MIELMVGPLLLSFAVTSLRVHGFGKPRQDVLQVLYYLSEDTTTCNQSGCRRSLSGCFAGPASYCSRCHSANSASSRSACTRLTAACTIGACHHHENGYAACSSHTDSTAARLQGALAHLRFGAVIYGACSEFRRPACAFLACVQLICCLLPDHRLVFKHLSPAPRPLI